MAIVPFTDNKFLGKVRGAVLQYARQHYGKSGLSPEDLTQEALTRVFEKIKSGKLKRLTCNFKTYVINVLKNVAREQQREASHLAGTNLPANEGDDDDVLTPIDLGIAQEAIKRWLANDTEQEHAELQQAAHDIVVNMDDPCKTILWSFYWDGKSMNEIAEIMDYNSDKVAKSQKSRCMSKVKLALVDICNRMKL